MGEEIAIHMDPVKPDKMSSGEVAAAIRFATRAVFTTMLDLPVSAGDLQVGEAVSSRASGVVALLGFAGAWVGNGRICCSPDFGCRIASHLLLQTYEAVDEDVLDAIGEVANMIIGNVKNELEERLGMLSLSTPTVIYGQNFRTRSVGTCERTTVVFQSGHERLEVQISLSPATSKPLPARSLIAAELPALA